MTSQITIHTLTSILSMSVICPDPILIRTENDVLFIVWNKCIYDYASGATLLSRLGFNCPSQPEINRVVTSNREWNKSDAPEGVEKQEWCPNFNEVTPEWSQYQIKRLKEINTLTKWSWVDPKNALLITFERNQNEA